MIDLCHECQWLNSGNMSPLFGVVVLGKPQILNFIPRTLWDIQQQLRICITHVGPILLSVTTLS